MGMIKFNGASSKDFGVEVETFPNYVAPQKEYEAIHIPGRNGDLLIDSGTYSNVEKRYKVNMVKEPPATEVSGPVANFKSNVSLPLSELKTNIDPVQDLHGYSKPWSGGGGKNKLKPCITNGTVNGITYTVNDDGTIRLSNTATSEAIKVGNFDLKAGSYIYTSGVTESFDTFDTYLSVSGTTIARGISGYNSFTLAQDSRVTFGIRVRNGITPNVTIKPMIRLASVSDATFEPYENICPISGFNSANIVGGKNLWNSDLCVQAFIGGDGKAIASAANITQNFGYYSKANQSITISANTTVYNIGYCVIRASDGVVTSRVNNNNVSTVTVTPTANSYIKVWISKDNNSLGTLEQAKAWAKSVEIQVEFGTSRTTYGGEVIINIPFGQTVYGGSLDVTNGKVTITHDIVDLGSLSWAKISMGSGRYGFRATIPTMELTSASNVKINAICEAYEIKRGNDVYLGDVGLAGWGVGTHDIAVYDDTLGSGSAVDFQTAMNGIELVFELATPTEITTTPENLTTLIGVNNIFGNSGDVYIKTNELATTYSGKMELIANWLNSASGYARLEDSYDPDYYRLAYFNQALDIDNLYDEAGQVTLSFICKPQKFYKSGEEPVVFTSAGRIQNRTQHTALPLLKVKTDNTDGTVSIGNSSFGISAGSGTDIIIDCELQNAYYGIENKNNYIVLNDGDFPRIEPGTQVVSFTGGVQSVEVIPRWWTV